MMRSKVTGAQRWVVKIGSALLTADGKGLDRAAMGVWVEQMVALHEAGVELVLVSSGAVAAGMSRLGWTARPSAMHELQAAAAIGQMGLVQAWESSFAEHGLHTAQILLTHDDLSDRKRYLNARSTLRALVELKVIPVINENDTVVTDEIRFGDNDTLAALVANLVEADLLVILTDRDGMFDADPRNNPDAKLIYEARADDPALDAWRVALVVRWGVAACRPSCARRVWRRVRGAYHHRRWAPGARAGSPEGGRAHRHLLSPERGMLAARKQWLAGHLQTRGTLVLDAGAVVALSQGNKSLLPVGVKLVQGSFRRGEMVVCVAPDGREIARGLANYSALEAQKIIGQSSDAIVGVGLHG
jgi:glutamate 5-kinase